MIIYLPSNCDLKSIAEGVLEQGMVRVPRFVLAASIAIISLFHGYPLVAEALTDSKLLVLLRSIPSIGALGWLSSLRACFRSRNAFRALLGLGAIITLFGRIPLESLSSSDSSMPSSSSSFPICPLETFEP
jgi:hypothetical protein